MKKDIENCPHCQQNHKEIEFKQMSRVYMKRKTKYTHWSICPKTRKNITLKIEIDS